ncbi:MAG: CapA family protein, partial [Thermomicrobiales bacterium]
MTFEHRLQGQPASLLTRRQVLAGAAAATTSLAVPALLRTAKGQESALVPAGQALVTSPRLPLIAIGTSELSAIVEGRTIDWLEAGSPVSARIELIALEGVVPFSRKLRYSAGSYEEVVQQLTAHPGGMAMVPVEAVDFRVNVLAVDGFDPLRHAAVEGREPISIAVVGDIVPGRNVHNKMVAYGDFTHPFRKVAAELNRYDLALANLEGNLSPSIAPPEDAHTFSFVSDPAMIDGLKMAGIDAV